MSPFKFRGIVPVLVAVGLLLVIAPLAGMAQSDAGLCPALVEQALSELGQNCDLLDRNSACYGYNRVDATFTQEQVENFFSQPADRSALTNLATIETVPLDVDQSYWGIAVLNVQANVPNTLPGQAVTFILLGDVAVENAVSPEDAVLLDTEPIDVTTAMGANVRSAPSASANLIGSLAGGTSIPADGLSPDGRWIRIAYSSGPGWISREVIDPANDVSALPVIDSEARSPMQSFYFTTGFTDANCNQAPPSLLVVQGPDNVKVDITANGADIQIGSTIALMVLPGNQLQLIVVSGEAQLGDITVPAGFKMTAPLSEDGKTVTGVWQNLAPLTQEELDELGGLENIPANLLHYPIILPTLEEIQALLDAFNQTSQQNTTVGGTTQGPAGGQADCSLFKPTSPLDGLPYGLATFYWDAAPGATSYRVNVFNENGALVGIFETPAPNTNMVGDMAAAGNGFSFTWSVEALVNGQVACSAAPVTIFREAPPPAPTAESTPDIPSETCGNEVCEPEFGEDFYTCTFDCGLY